MFYGWCEYCVRMSFVTYKRKVSADLERMSCRRPRDLSTTQSKSASIFRKLGTTPPRASGSAVLRPKDRRRMLVPVPPPPSRLNLYPPYWDLGKLRDWTRETETFVLKKCGNSSSKSMIPPLSFLGKEPQRRYSSDRQSKLLTYKEGCKKNVKEMSGDNNGEFLPKHMRGNKRRTHRQSAMRMASHGGSASEMSSHDASPFNQFMSGRLFDFSALSRDNLYTGNVFTDRKKVPTIRLVIDVPFGKAKLEKPQTAVTFSYTNTRKFDKNNSLS